MMRHTADTESALDPSDYFERPPSTLAILLLDATEWLELARDVFLAHYAHARLVMRDPCVCGPRGRLARGMQSTAESIGAAASARDLIEEHLFDLHARGRLDARVYSEELRDLTHGPGLVLRRLDREARDIAAAVVAIDVAALLHRPSRPGAPS